MNSLLIFIILYSSVSLFYIFWIYFFAGYHHIKLKHNKGYIPIISIIIPCYNEEPEYLEKCVSSVCNAKYPKKEVILINDGSNNKDTLRCIEGLKRKYKFNYISYERNKGKRYAMYKGIKSSIGEIIITTDSDTVIPSGKCFYDLVNPMQDKDVGAVCGQVLIKNRNDNFLTKMQDALYYQSFRIFKASQSAYDGVTCTPGPLSAYRREYLNPILEEWVNEKVLGKKMDFGDDRALTTLLIKKYKIYYVPNALVYTYCPDTYRKFLKQQKRWKKSWCIETIKLFSSIKNKSLLIRLEYLMVILLFFTSFISQILILFYILINPLNIRWFLFMLFLVGITRYSCCIIDMEFKRLFYGIGYVFFNFFVIAWIYPIALLELNKTKWDTR